MQAITVEKQLQRLGPVAVGVHHELVTAPSQEQLVPASRIPCPRRSGRLRDGPRHREQARGRWAWRSPRPPRPRRDPRSGPRPGRVAARGPGGTLRRAGRHRSVPPEPAPGGGREEVEARRHRLELEGAAGPGQGGRPRPEGGPVLHVLVGGCQHEGHQRARGRPAVGIPNHAGDGARLAPLGLLPGLDHRARTGRRDRRGERAPIGCSDVTRSRPGPRPSRRPPTTNTRVSSRVRTMPIVPSLILRATSKPPARVERGPFTSPVMGNNARHHARRSFR